MLEIDYTFHQVSPQFGVKEIEESLCQFNPVGGCGSYHDQPIFILESSLFKIVLFLGVEQWESDLPSIGIYLESLQKQGNETIEIEEVTEELRQEGLTLTTIKRFMLATLFDCQLRTQMVDPHFIRAS